MTQRRIILRVSERINKPMLIDLKQSEEIIQSVMIASTKPDTTTA